MIRRQWSDDDDPRRSPPLKAIKSNIVQHYTTLHYHYIVIYYSSVCPYSSLWENRIPIVGSLSFVCLSALFVCGLMCRLYRTTVVHKYQGARWVFFVGIIKKIRLKLRHLGPEHAGCRLTEGHGLNAMSTGNSILAIKIGLQNQGNGNDATNATLSRKIAMSQSILVVRINQTSMTQSKSKI